MCLLAFAVSAGVKTCRLPNIDREMTPVLATHTSFPRQTKCMTNTC
jgi:hypothetical protein